MPDKPDVIMDGEDRYLREGAIIDALPDDIEIYRLLKQRGVRKRIDIAKVIAEHFANMFSGKPS